MSRTVTKADELTGRHVLLIVIGFFAIVFAVNAYFVTIALSTHTGVVSNEPYRKGLKYNERIAAAGLQANLGWHDEVALAPDGRQLHVAIRDSTGQPVRGLTLSATLGRPATAKYDVTLPFEEREPGDYAAVTERLEPGAYIASVEVSDPARLGDGVLYRARKRLWLKP